MPRDEGAAVGLVEIRTFRPFPRMRLREVLGGVPVVSVLDRADSPGGAPPLFAEVAAACAGASGELESFVYGLGGRDLHPEDVRAIFDDRSVSRYVGLRGEPCRV